MSSSAPQHDPRLKDLLVMVVFVVTFGSECSTPQVCKSLDAIQVCYDFQFSTRDVTLTADRKMYLITVSPTATSMVKPHLKAKTLEKQSV